MKKAKYFLLFFLSVLCISGWGPFFFSSSNNEAIGSQSWLDKEAQIIHSQASNIDSSVLKLGLKAYAKAYNRGLINKQYVTIIDYSKPSSERRLWVIDVRTGKVLFNTWVSHGKNSGSVTATSFSNEQGSLKSSLGVFVTDEGPYMGGNGYSLRLVGLERGINDNAYRRNVVIHGAWYADPDVVKRYGQLGRSWGCPAVSQKLIRPIVDTIKHKSLVFVYSHDKKWLQKSNFLTG